MALDVTSSSMGAAIGLRQAQGQADFGMKTLNQSAQQQQQAVTSLLQPAGSSAGGNVTATRGQNLNIVV
ncbi:hypothetical protein [Azospirillum rugosum]|uniref:Motility protein n=1 Tax=Azospirillum rugosum TaxID=416170 RepID=A0ABS4SPJ9_9PROT|nr:hypothetical protein [Azospirillum rugosum]MBP2294474.1 hypothetical protein [Azospirillum rugosum]MDQ0528979.1 hypothetical protein [Azospirillum rugosum]